MRGEQAGALVRKALHLPEETKDEEVAGRAEKLDLEDYARLAEGERDFKIQSHRILAAEEETALKDRVSAREYSGGEKQQKSIVKLAWGMSGIFVIFGLVGMYLLSQHPDPSDGFIYMLGTLTGYAASNFQNMGSFFFGASAHAVGRKDEEPLTLGGYLRKRDTNE